MDNLPARHLAPPVAAVSPVELPVLVVHVQPKVAVHLSEALLSRQRKHEHARHLGGGVPQVLRLGGVEGRSVGRGEAHWGWIEAPIEPHKMES